MLILTAIAAGIEQNERIRATVFRTYYMSWIGMGLGVAWLGLSAGPVYYDRLSGDSTRFLAWQDYVNALGYQDLRAYVYTERLWGWYVEGLEGLGGGIAAFPSIHVAMAALLMVYAFTFNRLLGFLGVIWLVVIQMGSVMLGWHYAVDGYFSIIAVVTFWMLALPKSARQGRFPIIKRRDPSAL